MIHGIPSGPWLCLEDELRQAWQLLTGGQEMTPQAMQFFAMDRPPLAQRVQNVDGVAVIPLHGITEPRQSLQGQFLGWTSTSEFGGVLASLANNNSIRGVVVDVNSPGGLHMGTPELVSRIREASGAKPMAAIANPIAGSAALQFASSFPKFNITPSGLTGGLGSFSVHMDHSGELEQAGIRPTVFRSPAGKNELSGLEPLTDQAREHQQNYINDLTAEFVQVVAENRGVDLETAATAFGQGRGITAQQALSAGLVDRIATLDETIQEISEAAPKKAAPKQTDQLRRRRLARS